ncbi:hypothetical protein [Marinimicrobium locisalis]|uniref:hypothetical protein n=1 Tax=Marinimicrobium locisalis TaxID=546022 RepID=UPI0032213FC8
MRSSAQILEEISVFEPIEDEWLPLDGLLEELWISGVSEEFLPILFGVFERYPEEDGAGVLWSIVHGVESLPFDYEPTLKESMNKKPSIMGEIMLKRLGSEQAG